MANPGATANVKAVTPPTGWSGNVSYLPHRGAIPLIPDSNSKVTSPQLSLDLGATWTTVAVSGTPIVGVPGSPLFDF